MRSSPSARAGGSAGISRINSLELDKQPTLHYSSASFVCGACRDLSNSEAQVT